MFCFVVSVSIFTSCAVFCKYKQRVKYSAILHDKVSNRRFIIQHTKLLCQCRQISQIFIYGECVTEVCEAEWNWHRKSSQLIGHQQQNKANWFLWFRSRYHWRNLLHFSQRVKIVFRSSKITHQFKFFTFRFLSRKNREKKFILKYKSFFVTSIEFVPCALRENLSNRSSGLQIQK